MKSILAQSLTLCIIPIVSVFAFALSLNPTKLQKPLAKVHTMADEEAAMKVPGHNNVTYGPVPKDSQLFQIEFLEIAPSPIPTDQMFFSFLRGEISPSKNTDPTHLDKLLKSATVTLSLSADLADGTHEDEDHYTAPLSSTDGPSGAHVTIRNEKGTYVEHLSSSGSHDILTDCILPSIYIKPGMWTWKMVARLEDETCLFAATLTQWMDGTMR